MTADTEAGGAPRAAAMVAALVLAVAYAATAAHDVTFWDAGEFATAIATFGVPHPPGTPLYVAAGRALHVLVPGLTPVGAGIVLSVLASAAAGAVVAWSMARAIGDARIGAAAGIVAGAMGSVWNNATEVEVYGVALACSAAQFALAWRAHLHDDDRARAALLTVAALAVPLHLLAVVSAPAALLLACTDRDARVRWLDWLGGGALLLAVVVASRGLPGWTLGTLAVVAALGRAVGVRWLPRAALGMAIVVTGTLILFVRAQHAPWLAQGDPATWGRFLEVVAREQYAVAGPWPRRAPFWLQLGNLLQWADWQVLLAAWNDVVPHPLRTTGTIGMVLLGGVGARAHWRGHRASARAWALLLLVASVGVVVLLNLHAGPSYGHGILPDDAPREARERDYFFALAFWAWGAWAALGAAALAAARGALALAVVLVAGNAPALVRHAPDADALPRAIASELLAELPRDALLLTSGDNDTYPTWYLQGAEGTRRDVRVVVWPLLGARWYVAESWRALGTRPIPHAAWEGDGVDRAATLAAGWRGAGRPVAVSIAVPAGLRDRIGDQAGVACWVRLGLVDVAAPPIAPGWCPPPVDSTAVRAAAARLVAWERRPLPPPSPDGMARAWRTLLRCPRAAATGETTADAFLERSCNFR